MEQRKVKWDSPWLWFPLFGIFAIFALCVMYPKYQHRKARIDLQFKARQEIYRQQLLHPEGEAPQVQLTHPGQAQNNRPLWGAVLLIMGIISTVLVTTYFAVRLQRSQHHQNLKLEAEQLEKKESS